MKEKLTIHDCYESGQMSVYARLIREKKMTVEVVAEMTSPEFAQKAKALSYSRQCIDGPWSFQNPEEEVLESPLTWDKIRKNLEGLDYFANV